jgi:hypothetical protein
MQSGADNLNRHISVWASDIRLMRTKTLSARAMVSPDICTGFFIGKLTAMGSIDLIFTASLGHAGLTLTQGRVHGEL